LAEGAHTGTGGVLRYEANCVNLVGDTF